MPVLVSLLLREQNYKYAVPMAEPSSCEHNICIGFKFDGFKFHYKEPRKDLEVGYLQGFNRAYRYAHPPQ